MSDALRACADLFRLSWQVNRGKLVLAAALMLLQATAMPLAAPALGWLTDAAIAGEAASAATAGALVGLLAVAAMTAGHFAHVAYFELGELNFLVLDRQLVALSNDSAGLEHHERPEYADKIEVLRKEMNRVSWSSMQALLSAVSLAVAMGITAVLLAALSPWLLLLPLAAVPPLLAGRRAEALTAAARQEAAEATRLNQQLLMMATDAASAKELRVCRLDEEIPRRQRALWSQATSIVWPAELRAAGWWIGGQLVFAVAYVAATLLVVWRAVSGRGTVGDVVLAITLAAQVNMQVTAAVTLLKELQRLAETLRSFRWVRELVAQQAPPPPDAALPERIERGIRVSGVSFQYPGTEREVLGGVDLWLPAGSTVALVGENGAGKTTLVKMLCRFYEPTAGTIEVDGVDLRRFPLAEWRRRIAAGFQDFARFEFLARETVGVGDLPQIDSPDAVRAALHRARAGDLEQRLASGLETQLGKTFADGTELSGGQWQKLALGRSMMREQPLLLVLDEPTSALDAQAEHLLFEQYAASAARVGEQTGAITVLVSHRFSTVRMADLILVVADGRIAEAGGHDELIAADGLYAELYRLQAAQYR